MSPNDTHMKTYKACHILPITDKNQREARAQDKKEPVMSLPVPVYWTDIIPIKTAISEVYFVIFNATLLCLVLAFLSLGREKGSWYGNLYLPLKVVGVIKMCLLAVPYDDIPWLPILADMVSFYILAAIRLELEADYLVLDVLDEYKFGAIYKFFMGYIWSLQIDFTVRFLRLFIDVAYKLTSFLGEDVSS